MESIIKTSRSCFFCGSETNLELHHCLHGPYRKKADKDGLVVYLCKRHHYELHHGANGHHLDEKLKQAAEYAWLMNYEMNVDAWRKRYGKNYL